MDSATSRRVHRTTPVKQRIYSSKGKGHVQPKYSFISKLTGNRINCTSKYMPH